MEESAEERRERLKAMRMEASQEGQTHNEGINHSAVSLSNPLLESGSNSDGQMQPLGQSFNYYTNPMAAFSGNKQKSKVSPQISQDYSSTTPRSQTNETFPSPSLQPHLTHSPNPRMQQPHGQYPNPNYPYTSNAPQGQGGYPTQGGYPGPGRVTFPSPGPHFTHGLGQGGYRTSHGQGRGYPSPGPYYRNNPNHGSGPGLGYPSFGQGGHPSPHSPGRGYPNPGPPHFSGPGLGYPNSSPGPNQGRGRWSGPSSGRGRGRWSGQGGGGRGGHNHVTAEDRPDMFYNKSMVEDPWKFLEPVIWKSHKKPWFLHAKKPRVSESPRPKEQQSGSQPSLAEILAASFNDAVSDEPNAG